VTTSTKDFFRRFRSLVELYRQQFDDLDVNVDEELEKYKRFREELRPMVLLKITLNLFIVHAKFYELQLVQDDINVKLKARLQLFLELNVI